MTSQVHHRQHQHNHGHQGESYVLYLDVNGGFPDGHEKQFVVHAKDKISIILDSFRLQETVPILITNFPSACKGKGQYVHPVAPVINQESSMQMSEQDLFKKYTVFRGFFNSEGSWEIDLQIEDFDGSLQMQVLFLQTDVLQGQREPVVIKSYGRPEWFMVQPRISILGKPIGMDQLIIQTVLPYSLGKISNWVEILTEQINLGYNGFHFPPIQMLGSSKSYYSIKDHLIPNPEIFDQDLPQNNLFLTSESSLSMMSNENNSKESPPSSSSHSPRLPYRKDISASPSPGVFYSPQPKRHHDKETRKTHNAIEQIDAKEQEENNINNINSGHHRLTGTQEIQMKFNDSPGKTLIPTILPTGRHRYPIQIKAERIPNNPKEIVYDLSPIKLPHIQSNAAANAKLNLSPKRAREHMKLTNPFWEIKHIVHQLEKQGALSFVDILLNHTSHDSQWILDMPYAVYNPSNTPLLASALELDQAIQDFSDAIANGKIQEYPNNIVSNEEQLDQLMVVLENKVFKQLRLEEYFLFDTDALAQEFKAILTQKQLPIIIKEIDVDDDENIFAKSGFNILTDYVKENAINQGSKRFGVTLDISQMCEKEVSKSPRLFSIESFSRAISHQNKLWKEKVAGYIREALEQTRQQIKYYHIVLKNNKITDSCPLVPRYFTKMANGVFAANNGWIRDYDPLKNFAEDNEFHYLRRTIFIWGDLIKLRFGQQKSDAPGLWKRMKRYVQEMAKVFHGFRLDNAHSTPLVVGEYLMRCARNVNKNLLVFAELFTGDGEKDAIFSKRLGLNALVRELKYNKTTEELCKSLNLHSRQQEITAGTLKHFYQADIIDRTQKKILTPHMTKSIAYDQSHDNEATIKVFSHKYPLSLIALSSFSHFIQGTVYGFDELYPERLSVVNERRKYRMNVDCEIIERDEEFIDIGILLTIDKSTDNIEVRGSWNEWTTGIKMNHFESSHLSGKFTYLGIVRVPADIRSIEYKFVIDGIWQADETKQKRSNTGNNFVTLFENSGMVRSSTNLREARKRFIEINQILNKEYPFVFSETYPNGFIAIMRETPKKDTFYVLITRTALEETQNSKVLVDIECPGMISSIEGIFVTHDTISTREEASDDEFITGKKTLVTEEYNLQKYASIKYIESTKKHALRFFNAPPSLSIVLKCALHHSQKQAIQQLNHLIAHIQSDEVLALYQPLTVNEVNYLFFSCEAEEQERSGYGMYNVPKKGPLIFAGFGGVFKEVNDASLKNELSRPLFKNLRDGDWYLDYAVGRLKKAGGNLEKVTEYIEQYFNLLKTIPRYLIPHYFCQFILNIQQHAHFAIYSKFKSENTLKLTSEFHKSLFLANYQFLANLPSTKFESYEISMAAGLPQFAAGWSRVKGRDTFISFRGSLLIPGLYNEALSIICMFASTFRHGLIPNLLNNGVNPRYNSRDTCWWFIKAVKDYIHFANSSDILHKQIKMKFLSDDKLEHEELLAAGTVKYMKIHEIIYQIFARHAKGIQFREWKAGWDIDTNMDTEGFNIELKLEEQTGFILGGNRQNCLTWMDKMGSSVKAGNKGIPATCRDGAPIEMTALLKLCVDFAANCSSLPVKEVITSSGKKLSFRAWSLLISQYFERSYWIPNRLPSMDNMSDRILRYITRKGIYKDLYKSSHPRCEFQLRPNAQIAIALAPELFSPQNALLHLATVECMLLEKNSIGLKTLDKIAKEYVPYFDNSDDGTQPKTAQGFSQHNGPEWVWIYGYYLKALLEMNKIIPIFTKDKLMSYLSNQKIFIKENEWLSLPETTNQNNSYNQFSCQSQAWSIAPIVEICFDSSHLAVKIIKG